ncbi:MAG: radical SAM protein [Acidobacteriota bacterium]
MQFEDLAAAQPKIDLYLLKATEFCNLNCPYCYMFNLRDFSFREKPKIMSQEIVEVTAQKAVALAIRQGVPKLTISLHGGEPLLAGLDWYRSTVDTFRRIGGDAVRCVFTTQTNGVLLDEAWVEYFASESITVGISMDGIPEVHDKYRVNFAGRGSYRDVERGLKLLLKYPAAFGAVLCVIDPEADGLDTYRHFRSLGVPAMDFLWPLDHNWDNPPAGHKAEGATPFADYLIPIFDEWWENDYPNVRIRYFEQLVKNIFGARGGLDSLGGNPVSITSIDSDGSIEPVDSLKACGDGFTSLGLNILESPLESVYQQPLFQQAIAGQQGLCQECRECSLSDICGGGYLPHRYSAENQFLNPTVYCRDVWQLTTHILRSVKRRYSAPVMGEGGPAAHREEPVQQAYPG